MTVPASSPGVVILGERLGMAAGDDWLFRDLDLALAPGECLVLTGANGAGKSTLLRCLYGAQAPNEGSLTVCGGAPDERSAGFRRRVAALLDDSALFAELTVRQHLDLLIRGFPGASGDPAEAAEWAGLGTRLDVAAGQLSAGQRRRLLLLGCVLRPHEVLLLDEPERALDATGRDWLATLIERSLTGGAAVVAASHHRPLAARTGARVVDLS